MKKKKVLVLSDSIKDNLCWIYGRGRDTNRCGEIKRNEREKKKKPLEGNKMEG